jgi:hypothetical protein
VTYLVMIYSDPGVARGGGILGRRQDRRPSDRALEIAAGIPEAPYGLVEVRPTMTYDGMDVG